MCRAALAALLAFIVPVLSAAAPLRVVTDEHYPPFVYRDADGKLQGYTIDLWKLWQQKTGIPVELRAVEWADVQPILERGEADVIDPIFSTPERTAYLDFSAPYMSVPTAVYADASIAGIHDIASLKGFQVGVQANDACAERLQDAGITSVRVFPTYTALMDAAARQDVKLLCLDDYSADFYLYRLRLQHRYVKAFEVANSAVRRAVRKGDSATLARVAHGMALIPRDQIDALREKWMGRPLIFTRYARSLAEALVVLAGLVLLLAVWLASVRKAVRLRTAELEREKAQLRTLVESSPDMIWLKDASGVYRACNQQTAALLGRPRDAIVGKRDDDLFEPSMAERYRRDDATALQHGTAVVYEEQLRVPGASDTHTFETIKTPIRKPDGTVLGVLGVARDITRRKEHEQTIRDQERLLKEMSVLARIGAWEMAPATGAFDCTEEVRRIYEADLGPVPAAALGDSLFRCEREDRAQADRALDAALRHGTPFDLEVPLVTAAGHRKWLRVICGPVLQEGRVVQLRGTVQDITRRRNLEESMRMANLIYQTSSEAIVVTDEANRILDANPAFTALTGYALPDVLGTQPSLFDSSMHDPGFYGRLWHDLAADDYWQGEILDRNSDGSFTAKFVNIRLIRHPDGRIHRHVVQFQDISEQKKKDEVIWRQTNFDALTGLPNRRLFLDRLAQDIKKAHGRHGGLGVLLLDLDRFKDINDSLGQAQGDSALVELARRLGRCVPEDATVGRLGGDLFGLVVGSVDHRLHLQTMAQTVLDAVAAPMRLGAGELAYVSASAGISVYPDDGLDAADLVRNAEHAVHLAKRSGRGQFQYFMPSLQRQAHATLRLMNDLRDALARRELQVYYQPIVDAATGRVRKAETLLRWMHPREGMVSPARFIPLAEETRLIDEIGDWVLSEAVASTERWRRKYGCVIELSVNISPRQFDHPGPLPWLERIVSAGLPRDSITVEITEGVLVNDAEQLIRCLDALHAVGAKVSIDDFGTGFSALAYLKHFEVDYLKIDKSFINKLTENGSDKAVTEAIIDLAHRLGIETIAEGVESGAQRDLLAAMGCNYIQGHYYSQAVSREAFEAVVERQMAH